MSFMPIPALAKAEVVIAPPPAPVSCTRFISTKGSMNVPPKADVKLVIVPRVEDAPAVNGSQRLFLTT
jgi:hypothetical protein